ncbi:Increased rDNA silencing protein [Gnomoniopsis smithogilvyi]|uniref:Increased rDNA silencing protein n=1 Tax=Gnomoniopsis smithogilvyi TaxID=1191159 RepID=A0A9W9CX35_9PEZI|nr:Increased rDNA silencing protein [Gnomoniopsis smithogilvyi]
MNLPSSSSNTRLQLTGAAGSEQQHGPHRLTPQEAALRGASLAFQKQQHQAQEGGHTHKTGVGNGGISRHTTGASNNGGRISRQPTGSSIRSQRDYADEATERERERERKALFLSSTPEQGKSNQHLLLPPGARPSSAATTDSKSASFIAATLAASRSASPGTASVTENGAGAVRRSPLREPVGLRRGSAASGGLEDVTDTTSLAPATSLISLFEGQRETDDLVKGSLDRPAKRRLKPISSKALMGADRLEDGELDQRSIESISKQEIKAPKPYSGHEDKAGLDSARGKPKTKPKPSPKPRTDVDTIKTSPKRPPTQESKLVISKPETGNDIEESSMDRKKVASRPSPKPKPKIITRPETPTSPVFRRANTEIVSPRPRRPKTKPRLEGPFPSSKADENPDTMIEKVSEPKPKIPLKALETSPKGTSQMDHGEVQAKRRPSIPLKSPIISIKNRPPAPRKSSGISERLSPELRRQSTRRQSAVSIHDGQEEPRQQVGQDSIDIRPTTSDSRSSNDSFVSASSVPTRDDADSLLTIEAPSSRSVTPKGRPSRPASAQPSMALPLRKSATGSSQLPLDSLSSAIMAGSLASARHTPSSLNDGRTPPPLPPSRRRGGTSLKHKSSSRRASPHRMKHTLRQPKSLSDDEEARRPHHKKGLNHKKHAHHEGSRSRWREEITEREKKRYEAVWASNRGTLLVTAQQACSDQERHPESHQRPRQPVRNESYEELSEHVANVIVRDIWSRSRLPELELAEVWDLVYGHGRPSGSVLHGALNKQEFVVGMWLIDQRLRGARSHRG